MDKKKRLEKRNNFILLCAGILLVMGLLVIYREGTTWFTVQKWSHISLMNWISISVIFSIALVLQYYFFSLLRYSFFKYLILWLIPIIWLFNNALVAMHRFFDGTIDITSPAGWFPLGDLLGGLLSAIYLPLLVSSGVVVAIIDSGSAMLTQDCYYVGIALDVAKISGGNIISNSINFINVIWDFLSNSFVQQVLSERSVNRPFLDFSLTSIFSLLYWDLSIGYSLTCILI